MKIYWAMVSPATAPQISTAPVPHIVIGQDRFRWLAALAPLLWALWHRQWRWSVFLAVIAFVVWSSAHLEGLWLTVVQAAGLAINLWYGYEAEALKQADYARLGYRDMGPIWAISEEDAYRQAAHHWYLHAPSAQDRIP